MKLGWGLLLAAVLVLPACNALAQELSPELQRRLQRFQGKPPSSWAESDFAELEDVGLAISREVLEFGLEEAEKARLRSAGITLVKGVGRSPAWIEGGSIRISADALGDVWSLGMYLGHDIYIGGGDEFELPIPLISRPFAARAILPLIPSLREGLLASYAPPEFFQCPAGNMDCSVPQAVAIFAGTVGFLIAHEMSHLLLGHQPMGKDEVRPIEEELAADRKAWSILQRGAPDPEDDGESVEYRMRVGIEAGPLLLLRWQRDVAVGVSSDVEAIEARIEALTGKVSDSVYADVFGIVDPEPVVGALRGITFHWSEIPDELYVNGVKLAPQEFECKTLQVFGRARVFARREGRFAYTELRGRQSEEATLIYRPLASQPLSAAQIKELRKRGEWFDILLGTATPSLTHRAGVPVRVPYEALHRMGLGNLIDPVLAGLSREEKAMPLFWRRQSQPLGTWRPSSP